MNLVVRSVGPAIAIAVFAAGGGGPGHSKHESSVALIKEGTTRTSGLRSGSGGRKQTNLVEYIIIRNQNLKGNGNKKEDNTDDDEHGH